LILLGALFGLTIAVVAVALMRRHFLIVTITGGSMLPSFAEGDRVLARRLRGGRRRTLRVGDVIVADLPSIQVSVESAHCSDSGALLEQSEFPPMPPQRVVKRVAAMPGDPFPRDAMGARALVPADHIALVGDNLANSTDSRTYGYVPMNCVVAIVVRRLR